MTETVEKVLTCLHCGNKTLMKRVSNYHQEDTEEVLGNPFDYEYINIIYYSTQWNLYMCPACNNATLEKESCCSEERGPDGNLIEYSDIIYPTVDIPHAYYPRDVKDAYLAALKVRNLDGAICVLGLRRALEKMVKEQGAKGKDLFEKLKYLQENKILPPIMGQVAYILRKEGNSAAHADEVEFDPKTVEQMIEFTRNILDYVYTLPKKIDLAQSRLKETEEKEKVT